MLNENLIRKAETALHPFGNSHQHAIIRFLGEKGEASVTEIGIVTKLIGPHVSYFLQDLRRAHYVKTRKCGKHIYYSLNYERLHVVNTLIKMLVS